MAPKAPKKAKATSDAAETIHRRRYQGTVRVGLDPADREPLVHELTGKLRDTDALRIEQSEVASGYREKISALKEEIDELVLKLEQGIPEPAELEEIKDFKAKKVTIVRVDTKAIVEKRDMTEKDFQLDLGGKTDPDPDDDKDGDDSDV